MQNLTALCIIIATITLSCQRNLPDEIGVKTLTTIAKFSQTARQEQQSFVVNAGTTNVVVTKKGTKVSFPGNGFVNQEGFPVTGDVEISVKDIFTPMDMILNDMPTVSGNQLLESGGEFKITASQNNKLLRLAPGTYIKIEIPDFGVDMSGMKVFNGVADANKNIDWVVNNNPGNFVVPDSLLLNSNLFSDDINWINCDKVLNEPTATFTVFPGNGPYGDSANVFVHLTGRKTVARMNWIPGLSYYKSDNLPAVPSTIVGISVKNGQFFASITPVNVLEGGSVTMSFSAYTEEQLKERLSKLN